MALKPYRQPRPHAGEHRQQRVGEELEGRSGRRMRPALDHEARGRVCQHQRHHHGLHHQRGRARRADGEVVVPRHHRAGPKGQLTRADSQPRTLRRANRRRRFERGDMLAHQAGLRAPTTDVLNGERLPRQQRQRRCIAQHLPPAFAFGTVDGDHVYLSMPNSIARDGAATRTSMGRPVCCRMFQSQSHHRQPRPRRTPMKGFAGVYCRRS